MSAGRSGYHQVLEIPVSLSGTCWGINDEEEGIIRNFKPQDSIEGKTVEYPVFPCESDVRTAGVNDTMFYSSSDYQVVLLDKDVSIAIDGKTIHPQVAWMYLTATMTKVREDAGQHTEGPISITFWSSEQEGQKSAVTASCQLHWSSIDLLQCEGQLRHEGELKCRGESSSSEIASRMQPEVTLILGDLKDDEQEMCMKGRLDCLTKHLVPVDDTFWTLIRSQEAYIKEARTKYEIFEEWSERVSRLRQDAPITAGDTGYVTQNQLNQAMPALEAELLDTIDTLTWPGKLIGLIPEKDAEYQTVHQMDREGLFHSLKPEGFAHGAESLITILVLQ